MTFKSPAFLWVPLGLALTLSLLDSCLSSQATRAERGHDPWVFRSVMDAQPRMLTLALAPDFWLAYHTDDGALYKAWQDGVDFDGAVYTTRHGPQPTSLGPAWIESDLRNPWTYVSGTGDSLTPSFQFLGHHFEGDRAYLDYRLRLPDGHDIALSESPDYQTSPEGYPGLERVFRVAYLPKGGQLFLHMDLQSLLSVQAIDTDGEWHPTQSGQVLLPGGQGTTLQGVLQLREGQTHFTAWLTPSPTLLPVSEEAEALHPGLALIEGSDCKTCHNETVKTIGPAYTAIAERYETSAANVAMLARKVMRGGAGVWGEQAMTAHPDLTFRDATTMVGWILTLDGEAPLKNTALEEAKTYGIADTIPPPRDGRGIAVNVWQLFEDPAGSMPAVPDYQPVFSGVMPALHAMRDEDFGPLAQGAFYLRATGYLKIPRAGNYVFRLVSDDGSILSIDGQEVINHDGNHGATAKDGELLLSAGKHPFVLDFYEAGGGQALSLQWIAYGEPDFSVVPPSAFSYETADLQAVQPLQMASSAEGANTRPGDGRALADVHPSFRVQTIRPESFQPKVGGLDFLPDGRIVLSTWDPDGSVWIVSNFDQADRDQIQVKRIASGLAEPLGLKVVDGELYVLQKQELTQLIDTDGDEIIDVYRTVCNGWRASANFHEFAFGLVYRDGYFYATLATAILPGGASAQPQIPDRGKVVKISRADGSFEFVAHGLRTPNGVGLGLDGEIFVADNQGDWLPASKIVHVQEGAWYGSRSVDFAGTANLAETLPVVWLPQDEIGNSPSQPVGIEVGPYAGQLIHGEVTHGGIKRVFVEEVGGALQGAVFRFTQGLEAGVNRLVWGPDGRLYIGGIGNPGNWGHEGKLKYGLQRLTYTGDPAFEMLAVRALPGGFEIEFTEPLAAGQGESASDYGLRQWYYLPTENYGGPKMDDRALSASEVEVSADRKKVRLTIPGLKAGHVVYFRLSPDLQSEAGRSLWSTEAWYTLNRLPAI